MDCFSPANKKDTALFCIIVWRVWFCRNSVAHGSRLVNIPDVSSWSKAFLDNYISTNHLVGKGRNPGCIMGEDRWLPPMEGFY